MKPKAVNCPKNPPTRCNDQAVLSFQLRQMNPEFQRLIDKGIATKAVHPISPKHDYNIQVWGYARNGLIWHPDPLGTGWSISHIESGLIVTNQAKESKAFNQSIFASKPVSKGELWSIFVALVSARNWTGYEKPDQWKELGKLISTDLKRIRSGLSVAA